METFETIHKRRTIKKFLDIAVEQDKLGAIIDAGRHAPNAGNIQDWRFLLVRNKATIEAIARACLNQLWIAEAQAVIIVGAKPQKTAYFYPENKDFFVTQTCAAAAENCLLAATDLGLASAWVSAFNVDELKRVLGMPDDAWPHVVIPIGYADEELPEPMRYKIEQIIYLESWGNIVKDVDWVLQYFNWVGRGIDKGEKFMNKASGVFNDVMNKFKQIKKPKEKDKEIPPDAKKAKEEIEK